MGDAMRSRSNERSYLPTSLFRLAPARRTLMLWNPFEEGEVRALLNLPHHVRSIGSSQFYKSAGPDPCDGQHPDNSSRLYDHVGSEHTSRNC